MIYRWFFALILSCHIVSAKPQTQTVPDFTKGDKVPARTHDWNLGPTGARGWIYGWRGESKEARQILITKVTAKSPAAGVLQVDDVILGVAGKAFSSDARITFAKAITAAESSDGNLKLLLWRKGKQLKATVKLAAFGKYSKTAPWKCVKSEKIFTHGCENLAERMRADIESKARRKHPIQHMLNALALLSSPKRDDYMDVIKHEVEWAKDWQVHSGYHCWDGGWVNLLLAEYFFATGDKSVQPSIKRISLAIANGQSNVGTWGHRFAYEHNGILRGYGAMNQVGLSLTASLVMAREAGVTDPEVYEAIEKSTRFLRFYVGKGAIPYGDHHPWLNTHDDNGKASAAAVLFDFLDDTEAMEFFSRLGVASHSNSRETGHTGNFFNMLWALPGVSRSGPEATGAWINQSAWLLDLARRHDYSFDYLGIPGDHNSYHNWDCTGLYLLGFGTAHGQTRLTGKKSKKTSWLSEADAADLIKDGIGWTARTKSESYDSKTDDELISALQSWSPVVRERAAIAIAKRKGDMVGKVLNLANSDQLNSHYGACAAFEQLGNRAAAAVPRLVKMLDGEDRWLRVQAAEALAKIGRPAAPAIPRLLELAAEPASKSDPRGHSQRFIAFSLFNSGGLLSKTIENVDRDQLRKAIVSILENEDGRARGSLASVYRQLTYEEIKPILPAVLDATINQSPSGVMFSDGVRKAGLELLAKHRIAEGLPLCLELIELDRWKGEQRSTNYLNVLARYGAEASSELPKLEAYAKAVADNPKFKRRESEKQKHLKHIEKTIAKIKSAKPGTPLRNISG